MIIIYRFSLNDQASVYFLKGLPKPVKCIKRRVRAAGARAAL